MNGEHSIPSILFSLLVMIEKWGERFVLHLELRIRMKLRNIDLILQNGESRPALLFLIVSLLDCITV